MSGVVDHNLAQELIQHEIEGALHWFNLDRRDFLKLLGSGVLVCLCAKDLSAQESGRQTGGHALPQDIASWLHIAGDGWVTAYTGKVEIGQNIRTSLAQQVAEELRVPVNAITMVMGDTELTPWDGGTFGSRTTPTMGPQLKTMAVAARELLTEIAAQRWKTKASGLVAADGKITNPQTKQTLTYGELASEQKLVKTVSGDPQLASATQWKIAGKPVPKVDVRQFVTGKHQYASDMSRPGMMFGKVLRPTGFKATLTSLDAEDTKTMAGVQVVRDGEFVGVVAPDAFSAERALKALKAQWNVAPQLSDKELFDYLKKNLDNGERASAHVTGSVEQAIAPSDVRVAQTYTVQYIAHAPLEPRAAVAEWNGDKLTVWTGTQRPFAVRDDLAQVFRIPSEKVRVIVPDTGSAYGGKHTGDAAIEAARLAKTAGTAVKVVWTREEEFTWAYFRPAGVIEARSGTRRDGTIVAWEFHNYNSGPAAMATPYNIPNQKVQFHPVRSPLRQGSYRALAATANHFARETHMDEIAHELKMDPLEFRLKNLADPRLQAVFEAAAGKFGWGQKKSTPERSFGIAGGFDKGGYIATCVEIEMEKTTRSVRIRRIVEAFECGAVVNPEGLKNLITGAIVQGIGGALFEKIRFDNGKILNPHFAQYRVPRFSDTPAIEVIMLDRKDLPSAGAGETPIVGVAPAVANAMFAATGVCRRSLPLQLIDDLISDS